MKEKQKNSTCASLARRLSAPSATIGENTRLVLLKGSDIATVSEDQIGQMVDVVFRNGLIALETPTGNDLLAFLARLIGSTIWTSSVKKYTIDWYCDNRRISVREGYTVETD